MSSHEFFVLGLTGSIGMGKSTVSGLFRKAGVPVLEADQVAMKDLEAVVHPLVARARQQFLQQVAQAGGKLAVVDVPLLYETGGEKDVDAVLVVSAPYEVQKRRVLARPGMTEQKFAAILARQVPDEEKRRRADFVIPTDVSLEETQAHVAALITALSGRAGRVFRPTASSL